MQKYYKVISWINMFRARYEIEEIHAIALTTCFVAKEPVILSKAMLRPNLPVLHFAKGPLNTLCWYEIFEKYGSYMSYKPPTCVYEIRPMGRVFEGKSNDEYKLLQYGASIIEFVQRIPISQIAQEAIKEYEQAPQTIHNHTLEAAIKSWQEFMRNKELWQEYLTNQNWIESLYE